MGWDRKVMTGVKITALPNYWLEYLLFDASAQIMATDFQWVCIYLHKAHTALAFGWQHWNKQSRHHPLLLLYAHTPLEPTLGLQWLPLAAREAQWQGSPGSARLHCVGLRWLLIKSGFLHEMRVAHNSEMQMASTSCVGEMKDTL